MVSLVTLGRTKESKKKKRKSSMLYNSIQLTSIINTLEKSLETMNRHLTSMIPTHSAIDPTTKSVLRLIKSEILNITTFNTTVKQEIVPELITHTSSTQT